MPKRTGYSPINQLGTEKPTKKDLFKHTPGSKGISAESLDDKFRKPFPNMGKTPTGTKHE